MPQYQLRACTTEDANALARNNMSAFWTDDNWVLIWKSHRTLEQVIEISSKRQARNLLRDRNILRHQAAVESDTGKIVGYARWKLPPGHVTVEGTDEPQWGEAQVPDVSEAEREAFSKLAESADWCPSSHMDALDEPVTKIKTELLAKKDYIILDYLAVHPDNKGRGIGTMLVQSGMRQAEKMGVDVFVLAFPQGKPVYHKLGFRMLDQLEQDDTPYGGIGIYGTYFMEYQVNHTDQDPGNNIP